MRSCGCADVDVAAEVRVNVVVSGRSGIPERHLAGDAYAGGISARTKERGDDRISVAGRGQVNSVVAHVSHPERHAPGQLLLNACVVLDHIGALKVVVDERRGEDTKNVWLVEVPHLIGDRQWKPVGCGS